jgi:hypothetical protein
MPEHPPGMVAAVPGFYQAFYFALSGIFYFPCKCLLSTPHIHITGDEYLLRSSSFIHGNTIIFLPSTLK